MCVSIGVMGGNIDFKDIGGRMNTVYPSLLFKKWFLKQYWCGPLTYIKMDAAAPLPPTVQNCREKKKNPGYERCHLALVTSFGARACAIVISVGAAL